MSNEKVQSCKESIIRELLKAVNTICKEKKLTYFAMGKLLGWQEDDYDSYPEERLYSIGMVRKDYDLFMKAIKQVATKYGLKVEDMCNEGGILGCIHSKIVKKKSFVEMNVEKSITISLRIEPYDFLPDDKMARKEHQRTLAKVAREYRIKSKRYIAQKTKKEDGFAKQMAKMFKSYKSRASIYELSREYYKLLRQYSNEENASELGRIECLIYPPHKKMDIFPVKKQPFLDTDLMVPANIDSFICRSSEEENQVMLEELFDCLKKFDKFCTQNDISYCVMRDLAVHCEEDDVDWNEMLKKNCCVGLPRKDYTRLLELLRIDDKILTLSEGLDEYPFICNSYARVLINANRKRYPGDCVCEIKLVPFDILPADYEEALDLTALLEKYLKNYKKIVDYEKGLTANRPSGKYQSSFEYINGFHKLLQTYNGQKSGKRVFAYLDNKVCVYEVSALFPTRKVQLSDFSVACSNVPNYWHTITSQDYIKRRDDYKTEILKRLDQFCRKYNLRYFAISKLVMGATVYNDAIPSDKNYWWDLGLIRDEYNTLVDLLKEHGKEIGLEYKASYDEDEKYRYQTAQIKLIGCFYENVCVRILPFDKVPEDLCLYEGFMEDIKKKNIEYRNLINRYKITRSPKELEKSKNFEYEYFGDKTLEEAARIIDEVAQSFNDDDRTSTYMRVAFSVSKSITEEELFPLQRVKFRDIEINCPKDTSVWQPHLDDELNRQVAEIQKADLMIMEEFDRICKKIDVGYFVCGGTMLGYMRHGGFIPWDDDVDVAMLRADYNRFLAEAEKYLPDRFFLQTRQSDPNIPYLFSKIRLDDTEYITKYNEKRDFHKGLCLDIFPFDYLPNDLKERNAFVEEVLAKAKIHHDIARNQYNILEEEMIKPRNEKEAQYIDRAKSVIEDAWSKNLADSQQDYLDVATRYNDMAEKMGLTTVGSFVPSYTWVNLEDLLPYQRGKFENIEVSVPKRPDIFLEMQYKNYMELPPKHQQIAHKLLRWSTWDTEGGQREEGK